VELIVGQLGAAQVKIVVVGGASTYTPELVEGIARTDAVLGVRRVVLLDPDAARLEVVAGLARRMLDHAGWTGELSCTGDPSRALDGADIVLLQLRVGGQAARLVDETLPHECGCIGQETTGIGGFAKALRTVPVVLDLADEVRRRSASEAWIIDFTNPVGIVTRALLEHGHRALGLCNVAIGFQRAFAAWLGVESDRVVLDHVGLNHLTWIRRVLVDGDDVLGSLLAAHGPQLERRTGLSVDLMQTLGAIPSYYLHYYYRHDAVLAEQRTATPRATEVAEIEAGLIEMYRDPALVTKPALLEQRGGAFYSDAAVQLIESLVRDDGKAHVVNLRNDNTIAGLPADAVVEVPARVGRTGAVAVPIQPLAPELAGLVHHVAAYERLTLEAAITGDVAVARRALLAHPLVGQWDLATDALDRVLVANARYLPQFGARRGR
jgi:6-phospho-beta-glucosidase